MTKKETAKTKIAGVEQTLKEGLANYYRGFSNLGGRLYLTERRLIFKAHRLNIGQAEESFPLKDIMGVQPRNTLFFVPNGLSVFLRDGREARFVVYDRNDWIASIVEARTMLNGPKELPPTTEGQ